MTNIEISWQSAPWWFGIKWRSLCVERMPRRPQLFAKEVQSLWLKLERSLCCLFAQNFVTAAFPPPVQVAGGKNLKISIILCYGCHNYHCYHGHYIILLYSRMKHEHLKCSGSALRGALYNIVVARRQKIVALWARLGKWHACNEKNTNERY